VAETFFQNLDKYLGEKAVILAATKDDKLIGFMLTLFNDKELISALIGLDYDYNRDYCTYFNLFYKTIELAIEKGMDKIDMGITTLDPKKDMGSSIVALNMYMKHSNPLLNNIISVLFDMVTPPDTTGPRNVFKEIF
jgi:predicted N-acyltransferase